MNLRQFLSAAASAAILLTSVTVPNVNAVTTSVTTAKKQLTNTTTVAVQTTTAPRSVQYTTTTTTSAPIATNVGTNNCCVTKVTTSAKDFYDSINDNKLKPDNGKYKAEVDRYGNTELYFSTDEKKDVEVWATAVIEPGEDSICNFECVFDKEKEAYKLVLHGDMPGTQDYYIEDCNDENSCIITVTVKDRELPKANGELRTKTDKYGFDGTYIYDANDKCMEIGFNNASECVFANTITTGDHISGVYSVSANHDPVLCVFIRDVGVTQAYVVDNEGKSCIVTINVKEPAVTTASPVKKVQTTYTDVVTSIWEGTVIETMPDSAETMILPITEVITQYVPRVSAIVTTTVQKVSTYWDGPEGTGAGPFIITEPDILTTPIGGYSTVTTTCPTTTRPGNGTDGWNPPPYMTTTAISNVLIAQNNDNLIADKYEVTVDQYSNAEVYFKVNSVRDDRLYVSFFDNENIAECANVPNDYKVKTIDGLANKLLIHGNKPGTTKAFVQNKEGDSCIITITVKGKDAPVINNKLKFLEAKEGEEYTVDISGHDHKTGGVLFDAYLDCVFAQVIEGNDDLTFGNYIRAGQDGVFTFVEIATYGNGTYKVLFTDNEGNNTVATVNVSEAPYADPDPYPGQPIGTEVPDLSGETTYTTTYSYADGGNVGTAPMTTEGFVLTTTTGTTPAPAPAEIPTEDFGEPTFIGDTDLSGDFGLSDITALGKYILGSNSYPLSRQAKANADVDRNKWVNVMDLSIMIEINLRPEKKDAILAQYPVVVDKQPVNTEVVIVQPIVTTTVVNYVVDYVDDFIV